MMKCKCKRLGERFEKMCTIRLRRISTSEFEALVMVTMHLN